jgi:hypothetical protein
MRAKEIVKLGLNKFTKKKRGIPARRNDFFESINIERSLTRLENKKLCAFREK